MFQYYHADQLSSLVALLRYFWAYFLVAFKSSIREICLQTRCLSFSLRRKLRRAAVGQSTVAPMFKLDAAMNGQHAFSRMRYLFDSPVHSDCAFLVDGTEIKAHKYLLALHSPRMEKLFFEPRLCGPVHLPFSEAVIRQVLRFIYHQEQDIFNADPLDVMEAAFHFQMIDLIELCGAKVVVTELTQIYNLLNLSCSFNCRSLKTKCVDKAREHPALVLKKEGYLELSAKALAYLLGEDVIKVDDEMEVISAVENWIANKKRFTKKSALRREIQVSGLFKQLRYHGSVETHQNLQQVCEGVFTAEEFEKMITILQFERQLNDAMGRKTQRCVEVVHEFQPGSFLVNSYKQSRHEAFAWGASNVARPYFKSISLRTRLKSYGAIPTLNSHYKEHIEVKLHLNQVFIAYGKYKGYAAYNDSVAVTLFYMHDALTKAYSTDANDIILQTIFHCRGVYELGPVPNSAVFLIPRELVSLSLVKKYVCLPCYLKSMSDSGGFCGKGNRDRRTVGSAVLGTLRRLASMFSSFARILKCRAGAEE